ncbi:hypothetical protein RUM44_007343 [Polyplax serrata]|uniref:Uncharacterized protein n=1 Tax=Polyplax serrata TaxID=468196 RepID=A0ABR1B0E8_POLSC
MPPCSVFPVDVTAQQGKTSIAKTKGYVRRDETGRRILLKKNRKKDTVPLGIQPKIFGKVSKGVESCRGSRVLQNHLPAINSTLKIDKNVTVFSAEEVERDGADHLLRNIRDERQKRGKNLLLDLTGKSQKSAFRS